MEIDSDIEEVHCKDAFAAELEKQLAAEDGGKGDDPERLPRESQPFPPLPDPAPGGASQLKQQAEREAGAALAAGDPQRAVDAYTLAMRTGGATAMMLANRGALLLKQQRPCAAIRDCTAALKINASMVKAYRVRGIAHRKLGNWRKAHSDVSEAQSLKYDPSMVDMLDFVAARGGKPKPSSPSGKACDLQKKACDVKADAAAINVSAATQAVPQTAKEDLEDLGKGQAVVLFGLQNAPHLNGKRGVVDRCDPRPAAKGRWEIEVRLPGGITETKSLKRENIRTLNKADRAACRAWAKEEKRHKREREIRQEREEDGQLAKCLDAKMGKLAVNDTSRQILGKLRPRDALGILDKIDASRIGDVNEYVATQVSLMLDLSDSDDDRPSKRLRE